jgi:hypothetical protein
MAGLVPAILVLSRGGKDVDARLKAGHDGDMGVLKIESTQPARFFGRPISLRSACNSLRTALVASRSILR